MRTPPHPLWPRLVTTGLVGFARSALDGRCQQQQHGAALIDAPSSRSASAITGSSPGRLAPAFTPLRCLRELHGAPGGRFFRMLVSGSDTGQHALFIAEHLLREPKPGDSP